MRNSTRSSNRRLAITGAGEDHQNRQELSYMDGGLGENPRENVNRGKQHPNISKGTPEAMIPNDIVQYKSTKYNLKPAKALHKKLQATSRDELCLVESDGQGVNLHCQAGLYELFRRAACHYYGSFKNAGLYVNVLIQRDKQEAIVQVTFRAMNLSGQTSYLVDLYHTSSLVRISGRGQKKFFEDDWNKLDQIIMDINQVRRATDPQTLNTNIQRCLIESLATIQRNKVTKAKSRQHTLMGRDTYQNETPCTDITANSDNTLLIECMTSKETEVSSTARTEATSSDQNVYNTTAHISEHLVGNDKSIPPPPADNTDISNPEANLRDTVERMSPAVDGTTHLHNAVAEKENIPLPSASALSIQVANTGRTLPSMKSLLDSHPENAENTISITQGREQDDGLYDDPDICITGECHQHDKSPTALQEQHSSDSPPAALYKCMQFLTIPQCYQQ